MLYSADDHLILSGDQILAKISPNVSVEAMDPDGDPLGLYLRSLERAEADAARGRPRPARPQPALRRPQHARGRAHRPSRGALSGDRRSLQGRAANRRRAGAGHFRPPDRRPAPARLRLRRGARACQRDDPRRPAARRQLPRGGWRSRRREAARLRPRSSSRGARVEGAKRKSAGTVPRGRADQRCERDAFSLATGKKQGKSPVTALVLSRKAIQFQMLERKARCARNREDNREINRP